MSQPTPRFVHSRHLRRALRCLAACAALLGAGGLALAQDPLLTDMSPLYAEAGDPVAGALLDIWSLGRR